MAAHEGRRGLSKIDRSQESTEPSSNSALGSHSDHPHKPAAYGPDQAQHSRKIGDRSKVGLAWQRLRKTSKKEVRKEGLFRSSLSI